MIFITIFRIILHNFVLSDNLITIICIIVFFSEAKCELLQNGMYVDCCKLHLGAPPPTPCEIDVCGKLEPTFTPSVDATITYKWILQFSVFTSAINT